MSKFNPYPLFEDLLKKAKESVNTINQERIKLLKSEKEDDIIQHDRLIDAESNMSYIVEFIEDNSYRWEDENE